MGAVQRRGTVISQNRQKVGYFHIMSQRSSNYTEVHVAIHIHNSSGGFPSTSQRSSSVWYFVVVLLSNSKLLSIRCTTPCVSVYGRLLLPAALDLICSTRGTIADCAHVAVTGSSYGGTQTHIIMRYLRSTYGGYGTGTRNAVAMLAQDAGYTLYWDDTGAQTALYSVAMIQNQGAFL